MLEFQQAKHYPIGTGCWTINYQVKIKKKQLTKILWL